MSFYNNVPISAIISSILIYAQWTCNVVFLNTYILEVPFNRSSFFFMSINFLLMFKWLCLLINLDKMTRLTHFDKITKLQKLSINL